MFKVFSNVHRDYTSLSYNSTINIWGSIERRRIMKKTFISVATAFCISFLIVFLAGVASYTSMIINDANDAFINSPEHDPSLQQTEYKDKEEMMADTYRSWGEKYYREEPDRYGFYGVIMDPDKSYEPVTEPRNFLEIYEKPRVISEEMIETKHSHELRVEYADYSKGIRIMLIDGSLSFDDVFFDISLSDLYCDDYFITGGTMTIRGDLSGNEYVLSASGPDYSDPDKTVPVEQWIPQKDGIRAVAYLWNSSQVQPELNDVAKKACKSYMEEYEDGETYYISPLYKEGWFTTSVYYSREIYVQGHGYVIAVCDVFNPMRYVIEEYYLEYILFLLCLIICESVLAIVFILLYRNQKMFDLRNRRMIRGIAHELKTPLAVTKACVENWEYIDEEQRPEYSAKIISEVDHMSDLITRLLDLSKLSGGDVKVHPEHIDLMHLTRTVYERMKDLANERELDVEIEGESGKDTFPVSADPDMMSIVIDNFMSNAIKFADKKITVKLSLSGRKTRFEITNDGAKISKFDQKRVWDVFYKTDESRSDRIGSSGVGLSVVKNILDLHKAKYGCKSSNAGTSFWFSMDSDKENEA